MPEEIARAAIHPAIGVARVGDSEEFFLAPQVDLPHSRCPGFYHDGSGALKREAIEFRIYGYDSSGNVVTELTADNADIQWSAHLANYKAAWYKFRTALDLPSTASYVMERRNPLYDLAKRNDLVIDPGERSIRGRNSMGGPSHRFDTGSFENVQVYLGELRTDAAGHLLLLGGHGKSGSPTNMPVFGEESDAFANSAGWYDDTADGPVWAQVTISGRSIPVEGAWAVVAPPNYAPDIVGWRTLYDLLTDLYIDAGWLAEPSAVSFARDIFPLLQRMSNLQWVSPGFATMFGAGGPFDFNDAQLMEKLSRVHPGDPHRHLRRAVFNMFRPRQLTHSEPRLWPWIYGDNYGQESGLDPDDHLQLSKRVEGRLRKWADGDFVADLDALPTPVASIDDLPLAEQPAMLDRAPLHFCLADAFHPGCELTWPMRHLSMYSKPFRIKRKPAGAPPEDYGDTLSATAALNSQGPLYEQGPGGLTRWMAVPWQVDTAGCRSGYEWFTDADKRYDPTLPTFWPARVPNFVLTEENYRIVMDEQRKPEERVAAFHERRSWYSPLEGLGQDQFELMISMYARMGVVEARPGPGNEAGFPATLYVERLPQTPPLEAGIRAELPLETAGVADPAEEAAAREAGWESAAQRDYFRRIRFGN